MSHYATAVFSKVLFNNLKSPSVSQTAFPKFKILKLSYTDTFTYVTFAAVWKGLAHLLAIHYDRYCIGKLYSFDTNESSYVHFELLQCMKNRTNLDESLIFEKLPLVL